MNSSEPELWVIIQNYELLWIVIHILIIVFIYQINRMIIRNYPESKLHLFLGLPSNGALVCGVWRHVWSQQLVRRHSVSWFEGSCRYEVPLLTLRFTFARWVPLLCTQGFFQGRVAAQPPQVHLWRVEAWGRRCHQEPLSTNGTESAGKFTSLFSFWWDNSLELC